MSLADVINGDVGRVFFTEGDGATQHKWGDKTILVLTDRMEEVKRNAAGVLDTSWENREEAILIHVPASCFDEKPEQGTVARYDGVYHTITSIGENDGVYDFLLKRQNARKG